MATEPELIRQAALELPAGPGPRGPRPRRGAGRAFVSLNGRPAAASSIPPWTWAHRARDLWHDDWILPAPTGAAPEP